MSNILFSKHSFICAEQKTGKESSKGPITYMALENVHLGKENCFHWKPPAASDLGQTHAESTWLLLLDRQGYRSTSRKINGRKIRKIRSHPSRQVSKCTRGHSCLLTEKGLCNHSEALGSRSWELLWQQCSKSHRAALTSSKASSHSHSCSPEQEQASHNHTGAGRTWG